MKRCEVKVGWYRTHSGQILHVSEVDESGKVTYTQEDNPTTWRHISVIAPRLKRSVPEPTNRKERMQPKDIKLGFYEGATPRHKSTVREVIRVTKNFVTYRNAHLREDEIGIVEFASWAIREVEKPEGFKQPKTDDYVPKSYTEEEIARYRDHVLEKAGMS